MILNSEKRKKIVTLHRQGVRNPDIMKKMGASYSQVSQTLHKARTSGELPPFKPKAIVEPARLATSLDIYVGNLGTELRNIDHKTMVALFNDAMQWNYDSLAEYLIDTAIERNKTGGKKDG